MSLVTSRRNGRVPAVFATLAAAFATVAFTAITSPANAAESRVERVNIGGDALRRAQLNLHHLNTATEYFDPATTAFPTTGWIAQWPGDTSGRLLLGLCRAYEVTGEKSPRIDALLRGLPAHLNAAGYMGELLPPGLMDEQYLAGNSWLIRALCTHHRLFGDAESKRLAAQVLGGLLKPALAAFPRYPVGRELAHDGEPGQVSKVGVIDGWRLTNDVGSGFMFLDGATDAYDLLPSPELAQLIDAMIAKFRDYDVIKSRAQTHATLTICRGLLRRARQTGDRTLTDRVATIWAAYCSQAMTENHENWVWFGRPDWTEGCAVVDSFEVALELWRLTGDTACLRDAQAIWHNAIPTNQWPNGGFGTCDCVGAKASTTIKHQFEAPWCCSMRGAEGFFYLREAVLTAQTSTLTWLTLVPHTAKILLNGQPLAVRLDTDFPVGGTATLHIETGNVPNAICRFFLPETWFNAPVTVRRNGQPIAVSRDGDFVTFTTALTIGDRLELTLPMTIRPADAVTAAMQKNWHRFLHGPLVLATAGTGPVVLPRTTRFTALGDARYQPAGSDLVLAPLALRRWPDMEAPKKDVQVVLFADQPVASPPPASGTR